MGCGSSSSLQRGMLPNKRENNGVTLGVPRGDPELYQGRVISFTTSWILKPGERALSYPHVLEAKGSVEGCLQRSVMDHGCWEGWISCWMFDDDG